MRHNFLTLGLMILIKWGIAQSQNELHFLGGMSNYTGDLQLARFSTTGAGMSIGGTFLLGLSDHFQLRASLATATISADDKNGPSDLRVRNLNFKSNITDGYLALQYRVFSLPEKGWSPYAFAGAGIFAFNPYTTFGDKSERIYLQPLGTEGQGLPEYPDRKMYSLNQFFIPFGGGLQFLIKERWVLGVELRLNKTFTDYLDDVSNRYPLPAPLLRDRGQMAVNLSWRRDEFDGRPFPTNEPIRGNPGNQDWYYHAGLSVGYFLPSSGNNGKMKSNSFRNKSKQLGCPKW